MPQTAIAPCHICHEEATQQTARGRVQVVEKKLREFDITPQNASASPEGIVRCKRRIASEHFKEDNPQCPPVEQV